MEITSTQKKISKILAKWNPIGVPDFIAEDEYKRYIARLIEVGKNYNEIKKELVKIITVNMGYEISDIHKFEIDETAEEIFSIYDSKTHNSKTKIFIFLTFMIGEHSSGREPLWEENIKAYYDESLDLATERAKRDAVASQHSYKTAEGDVVNWKLHSINLVNTLDGSINEGEEIFFRFLTQKEAQSLLSSIEIAG